MILSSIYTADGFTQKARFYQESVKELLVLVQLYAYWIKVNPRKATTNEVETLPVTLPGQSRKTGWVSRLVAPHKCEEMVPAIGRTPGKWLVEQALPSDQYQG